MIKPDILSPQVALDRLHPGFVDLMTSQGFAPARPLVREVWEGMDDRDGNFATDFQSSGFDARTWELFLVALLRLQLNAQIDWRHVSPDFNVEMSGVRFAIEAVTANPSQTSARVIDASDANVEVTKQQHLYPIRLGSALYSKLQRRYWELPHVAGLPLVLAIQDFHEPDSLYSSGSSLWQYLYGIQGSWHFDPSGTLHISETPVLEHRDGSKVIPSGFFGLEDASNISAVLFGNSGTIPKFNRMGLQRGYGADSGLRMIRHGLRASHDPNVVIPVRFAFEVGGTDSPSESWGEGLSIFHNPNAKHPLPIDLLPFAYHVHEHGALRSFLPNFHPLMSQTMIVIPSDG